jgi:adsorption protein B
MVHPLELKLIDRALCDVELSSCRFDQSFPQARIGWRAIIVMNLPNPILECFRYVALGAGLPAAGVSCGFARDIIETIGEIRVLEGVEGPFAADCLTEDYELGMLIPQLGGRSCFCDAGCRWQPYRHAVLFPKHRADLGPSKDALDGISLQGWDRLGWNGRFVDIWMSIRDRRGPLIALVLFVAYLLVVLEGTLAILRLWYGREMPQLPPASDAMRYCMQICALGLFWRSIMRAVFTGREYGWKQGLLAPLRLPVANIVMILAARRAVLACCRSLAGAKVVWDKTEHVVHPALPSTIQAAKGPC